VKNDIDREPADTPPRATALGMTLAVLATLAPLSCSGDPPNAFDGPGLRLVLLVSLDTLRPDHLSLYGYERETSPYLEELASESTVFRNAYAHVAFTLMSHASMLSSLLPDAHGVTHERRLSERVPLLAEVLAAKGYATYGFYGSDWLDPRFGFARGFDRWEFNHHGSETHEESLEVLDEIAESGTPSLLFLHFHDVHCGPLDQPGLPLYPSHPDFRDRFLPHPDVDPARHLAGDIYHDRVELSEEERQNVIAQYDGGILYVDTVLRDLTGRLKELELYDETLLIVTSDHGESLGHEGTFFGHGEFWEEGLRVPLLVKLPESAPDRARWTGAEVDLRVQTIDIAPTILRVAGLESPDTFQGHDLFDGEEQEVIASRSNVGTLITGKYKLVTIRKKDGRRVRLYDLSLDPGEEFPIRHMEELAEELADHLDATRLRHRKIRKSFHEGGGVLLGDKMKERLRSMGYLEDE